MRKWGGARKGQSILEYLIIAAVVIGAVIVASGTVKGHIGNLYNKSANKTQAAGNSVSNLSFE